MNQTQELLQQIAALPNTTVAPYRFGGGVSIIEQYPNRVRTTNVWLDRRSTIEHLQEYIASRAVASA